MTRIDQNTVLTKADLEMAVFLAQGEVDRYRIILEHDIRAAELMDPQVAVADTVHLPWSGLIGAEMTVRVPNDVDDVIRSDGVVQDAVDEPGTLYRAPVV
jgi:hypothetical protein